MLLQMLAPPPPPLKPRPGKTWYGLGWDLVRITPQGPMYWKDGLLPGTRTFMGHMPSGVDWVMLFNSGEGMTTTDVAGELDPRRDLEPNVQGTQAWPEVDFFDESP
jgi:hypothetical protein